MVGKFTRVGLVALLMTGTAMVGAMPAEAAQVHAKPQIGPSSEYVIDFYSDAQHTLLVGIRQNGPCGAFSYGVTTPYAVGGYVPCTLNR
ncbi:hypothetical protein [Kitasatospora viridis]|uniref:Secreted protein n=1 Tax=Kitasatospora viridis TaxID=281105 RepID=A0A561UC68_9ACTN|nr:hypothetical protein [Kitasatospora viridis]TWF96955.1 hypothetical protein FHX73_11729 [Kitasatospora viridis]